MTEASREPLVLMPGQGRSYQCGPMLAVFKADGAETGNLYTVSEWRIAPNAPGPGAHSHAENDEVFLVTEGSPSVLVGDRWHSLEAGSVVVVPATIVHDFENRTNRPAALFNVFMPGGFEKNMPAIIEWFGRRGEV